LEMLLIQQVKKRVNRRINLLNAASGHKHLCHSTYSETV
jgi:hypothetical protein